MANMGTHTTVLKVDPDASAVLSIEQLSKKA